MAIPDPTQCMVLWVARLASLAVAGDQSWFYWAKAGSSNADYRATAVAVAAFSHTLAGARPGCSGLRGLLPNCRCAHAITNAGSAESTGAGHLARSASVQAAGLRRRLATGIDQPLGARAARARGIEIKKGPPPQKGVSTERCARSENVPLAGQVDVAGSRGRRCGEGDRVRAGARLLAAAHSALTSPNVKVSDRCQGPGLAGSGSWGGLGSVATDWPPAIARLGWSLRARPRLEARDEREPGDKKNAG